MDIIQDTPPCPRLVFPKYEHLPNIGLYQEQVLNIVNQILSDICPEPLTRPMINNYIKNGALPAPVKKKYYRDHICYLLVIGSLKQVFTIQQLTSLFHVQKDTYNIGVAYDYYCIEYENALREAFHFTGNALPSLETARTRETILLRSMVLTAANRIFVEKYIAHTIKVQEP